MVFLLRAGELAFRVLGQVSVARGFEVVEISAAKPRLLLALLLARPNHVVAAERLIEELWPDGPPGSARTLLHGYVSDLRRLLEPDRALRAPATVLRTRPPGYVLSCDRGQLDALEFERLVAEADAAAQAGNLAPAREQLETAFALWQSPPFGTFASEPSLASHVARLEQLHVTAIETRVEVELARGRAATLAIELEALVEQHPVRERLWSALMLALYRSGRQADALDAYRRAATLLRDELGIDPGVDLAATQRAILRHEPVADRPTVVARPLAPPPLVLTDLIGREDDVAAVRAHVAANRLVTLTGPGGCGKTRLALEVARSVAHGSAIAWIDLASARNSGDVMAAAVAALGLIEQPGRAPLDTLLARAADLDGLLVLDNCEQVPDACRDLVWAVLASSPAVHVLATSREVLRLPGEVRVPVAPLAVPDDDSSSAVGDAPAVRLFVERAGQADASLVLTPSVLPEIAAICRRVEGIPLAIELAAAWTPVLSLRSIRERLADPLDFLSRGRPDAPDRQRTLRATIAWSYGLLEPDRQEVFAHLAVFPGSFSVEAATAVCTPEGADDPDRVAAALADLEAASLVTTDRSRRGATRFRLLDSLRQFGREALLHSGALDDAERCHAAYVHDLARRAARGLKGLEVAGWLDRLGCAHGDIRQALSHLLNSGRPGEALEIAGALPRYWMATAHIAEGRRWLARALEADDGSRPVARVRALFAASFLACLHYDVEEARDRAEEALGLLRAAGHDRGVLWALNYLGLAAATEGDAATALTHLDGALALTNPSQDPFSRSWTLHFLALAYAAAGRYEEQRAVLVESLHLACSTGDLMGREWALGFLGSATYLLGDLAAAQRYLEESLDLSRAIGNQWGTARSLAAVALAAGNNRAGHGQMRESLETFGRLGDRAGVSLCLRAIAVWSSGGNADGPETLLQVADAIGADVRRVPVLGHMVDRHVLADAELGSGGGPAELRDTAIPSPSIEEAVGTGLARLSDLDVQEDVGMTVFQDDRRSTSSGDGSTQ